jgi:hypothetical protein
MIDEIMEDQYLHKHGHPSPTPFGFNGCVPSPPETDEAAQIISKYSPAHSPVLLDTRRSRTELSNPVLARLAVTSQSTSYKDSSPSPQGSRSSAQSTSHEGSSQTLPGSRTSAKSTSHEGSSKTLPGSRTSAKSTSPEGSSQTLPGSRTSAKSTSHEGSSPTLPGSRTSARAPLSNGALEPACTPSFLVKGVQRLIGLPPCKVHQPSILFQATTQAAARNWELLREKGGSLVRLLLEQPFSVLSPGSEFRPVAALVALLGSHPLWPRWHTGLTHGASYPLEDYSDDDMALDLTAQLARGNHKSAKQCEGVLTALNTTDVEHGYSFCLPEIALPDITGAAVAPHGVVHQGTINELGQYMSKDRPTHDQSFSARPEGLSINDRCLMEELTPCVFGHSLLRLIHFVLYLRRKYPNTRIFIQKVDFKSAYRRMHLKPDMAAKCITVVGGLAFISLRLPFGGRPCPSLWSDLSETITDLSNALALDLTWDPETLHSPLQHLIPPTSSEPDSVPFAAALPTSVTIPDSDGDYKADVFIDDLISIILDDGAGCKRGAASSLLAIHTVGRPVAAHEPVLRNELTAEKKLIAESLLEEVKTTLGWLLDTRRLLIGLPMDKFSSWSASIHFMVIMETCSYEDLDTLVGRLNHVCFIIPLARHFMSRLRWLLTGARAGRRIRLRPQVLADLRLWLSFLRLAFEGISLNLISFRVPTHVFRSDAAEHGIGGFCGLNGKAWRLELPPDCRVGCREGISLNLFEFLGGIISVWVEILAGRVPPGSCLLAQGDSTSATGWLRKSNFSDNNHRLQLEAARHLAFILLDAGVLLYSQWFAGKTNGMSDSLSRDTHLSARELTALCSHFIPSQVPPNLEICPLPLVVYSWVISLLRSQPPTTALRKEPTRSTLWHGRDGPNGCSPWSSLTMNSLRPSSPGPGRDSLAPLPPQSDPLGFQDQLILSLLPGQSPIPSTMWRRPLWMPDSMTPVTPNPADTLHAFYSVNTGATKTLTKT